MTWSEWKIPPFITSVFFVLGVLTLFWVSINWILTAIRTHHLKIKDTTVNTWYGFIYMIVFAFSMQALIAGSPESWIFMNFQLIAVTFCGYFLNIHVKYYYLILIDVAFMLFNGSYGSWQSWLHGLTLLGFFLTLGWLRENLADHPWQFRALVYHVTCVGFGSVLWLLMKLKFTLDWPTYWQELGYLAIFEVLLYIYASMLANNTQLENQLVAFANRDALTSTGNYAAYTTEINYRFQTSSKNGLKLSMMMFDIDHFKRFNDTYGHLAGDEILKHVVSIAQAVLDVNDPGAKLFRTGGEEFNIVFPNYDLHDTMPIVTQIFSAVNHLEVPFNEQRLQISISVGVSSLSSTDKTATDFYKRVDQNLYYSKEHGRMQITAK